MESEMDLCYMNSDDERISAEDLGDSFVGINLDAEDERVLLDIADEYEKISLRTYVLDKEVETYISEELGKPSITSSSGGAVNQLKGILKSVKPIIKPVTKSVISILKPIIKSTKPVEKTVQVQSDVHIKDDYVFPSVPSKLESMTLCQLKSRLANANSLLAILSKEKTMSMNLSKMPREEESNCTKMFADYKAGRSIGLLINHVDYSRITKFCIDEIKVLSSQIKAVAKNVVNLNLRINKDCQLTLISSEKDSEDVEHLKIDSGDWGVSFDKVPTHVVVQSIKPKKQLVEEIIFSTKSLEKTKAFNERLSDDVTQLLKKVEEEAKQVDATIEFEFNGLPTERKSKDKLQFAAAINMCQRNKLKLSYIRLKYEESRMLTQLMKKDNGFPI